jgi:hypothetical protein
MTAAGFKKKISELVKEANEAFGSSIDVKDVFAIAFPGATSPSNL